MNSVPWMFCLLFDSARENLGEQLLSLCKLNNEISFNKGMIDCVRVKIECPENVIKKLTRTTKKAWMMQ